jgi:hypothetical protein
MKTPGQRCGDITDTVITNMGEGSRQSPPGVRRESVSGPNRQVPGPAQSTRRVRRAAWGSPAAAYEWGVSLAPLAA